MGLIKFTNFATSTIADVGGIGSGDLAVDVQPGDGALFPALTGSSYFYVVAIKTTGAREIMKVTARATDTFTIVRAQDNTSALAFDEDDKIELRANAAAMEMLTDLNGEELILDADADTSITADTDDQIDIKIGGNDEVVLTPTNHAFKIGGVAQVNIKDGYIEPETDDDIEIGSTGKKIKKLWTKLIQADTIAGLTEITVHQATLKIYKASPAAAASVSFTGLTSGKIFKLSFYLKGSGTLEVYLRFNNDSGANYEATHSRTDDTGNSYAGHQSAQNEIKLNQTQVPDVLGECTIRTTITDNTEALVVGASTARNGTSELEICNTSGLYNGAAEITRIDLYPSAGTFTGTVILEEID